MRKLVLLGLVTLVPLSMAAARLMLRDGTTYHGTFVSGDSRTITFKEDNGERHTVDIDRVQSLDFRSSNSSDTSANRSSEPAPATPGMILSANPATATNTSGAVIPAGRRIAIRTNESIDANTGSGGRSYAGIVAQDITTASGEVIVPRGSAARLVVRQGTSNRTNSGTPDLMLDVESLAVNGRLYRAAAAGLPEMEKTPGPQPSGTAGGETLGTQLGNLAGESAHTTGGAARSDAGGSTAVLTHGPQIKVPPDTLLTFQLDRPLRLQPER